MGKLTFIKDIKDDEKFRKSFNELAQQVFGINFENWYQHRFWTEKYSPYCFADDGKIIANVSVNKLNLIINGEERSAIQIGTVMTHPEYRNKGLSAQLMNKVLEEYENNIDIFYLFANSTVLNFYPKFGFKPINEHQYSIDYTYKNRTISEEIYQLDCENHKDLQFIYKFALERIPISLRFGAINTQELLMFYCMYAFNRHIYYLKQEDVIVLYKHENEILHIFDVISKRKIDFIEILSKIGSPETQKVVFHFTPDIDGDLKSTIFKSSEVLFVKTNVLLPETFKHPLTSQA